MEEKKSVWDFIDKYLPPAASIYGKIRQQTTGTDPFAQKQEDLPIEEIKTELPPPSKASNKTLLIVGGVGIVIAIATYLLIQNGIPTNFLTQKFKKNGQKLA
jgi:hypothetical protein